MKNRHILALSLILVVLLAVPAFADAEEAAEAVAQAAETAAAEALEASDESIEPDETIDEELIEPADGDGKSAASSADQISNEAAAEDPDERSDETDAENASGRESKDGQAAVQEKADDCKTEQVTSGGIVIVVYGGGDVYEKDGALVYKADEGYEISSIVSDKNTDVSTAGNEVIADTLDKDIFEKNSVVTFVFDEEDPGDSDGDAAHRSMGAIFE